MSFFTLFTWFTYYFLEDTPYSAGSSEVEVARSQRVARRPSLLSSPVDLRMSSDVGRRRLTWQKNIDRRFRTSAHA